MQQNHLRSPVHGEIAANVIQENFTTFREMMERSTWLADNLFEKRLLSRPILNKVLKPNSPTENLSQALLESIDIIESDGEKFNDFLMILATEPVHESLMTRLKTKYGKYNYYNINYHC